MGGGGGGGPRRIPSDQLRRLSERARDVLREGASGKRNVFISFAAEDLNEVNLLRGQKANEGTDLEFSDRSVQQPYNSENADYIRARIREKIRQASVTLVYLSDSTPQSKWVDWEIRESLRQGKGVVCVYSGDRPPSRVPPAAAENKLPVVPWKHDSLISAIEHAATRRGGET